MFKLPISAKSAFAAASVPVTAVLMAAPSFAADPVIPGVAITTEMLAPIVDGVTANIGIIMPVAIGLFAILLGVGLVPKVIQKFTNKN